MPHTAMRPCKCPVWECGSFTSMWWLQKVRKPSGPSRREGAAPPGGGRALRPRVKCRSGVLGCRNENFACVKCDAKWIRKKITEMKMRLIKVALKATGRG